MKTLGRLDIEKMKRDGWRFTGNAVRVGNGWTILAIDPDGNYDAQIIADPEQEPDKWLDDAGAKAEGDQLSLL